ncbi:MAG: mdoD [Betaproteobacteria bacterium]|nr:mdoD [Betaproteobacteria bacterium]
MQRRDLLKSAAALTLLGAPLAPLRAIAPAAGAQTAGASTFDYARVKGMARALAAERYRIPPATLPREIKELNWDDYQAISFREDRALWAGEPARFRAKFFHLGLFYQEPVRIFEVTEGRAREIGYDRRMFDYGKGRLRNARLPANLGFAGFRLSFQTDWARDVTAFLGASYFRAVGGEMQYGLSARALAIDTGMSRPEEFPRFTTFWLERPAENADNVVIYALLDSPSTTGAYRFDIHPGATLTMDIDAALYPRKEIERLGIAPLTSMYLHGENDRRMANDWRPELHDSDGLSMLSGRGEWIWRPLTNPSVVGFNAYGDENPRGFGLIQRDRNFDHYQDDGVFYERRPSVWVEPKAGWGKGSVQLVELPTLDETNDNIVTFWNPEARPQPGQETLFGYRLHWGSRMPASPPLATVVATRTGIGGIIGRKRAYISWRFAVDFAGGDFAMLGKDARVEPVISVSRGEIEITSARPLQSINGYRATFDYKPADSSTQPVTLRLYLRANGQPLTETWIYEWIAWDHRLPPT